MITIDVLIARLNCTSEFGEYTQEFCSHDYYFSQMDNHRVVHFRSPRWYSNIIDKFYRGNRFARYLYPLASRLLIGIF